MAKAVSTKRLCAPALHSPGGGLASLLRGGGWGAGCQLEKGVRGLPGFAPSCPPASARFVSPPLVPACHFSAFLGQDWRRLLGTHRMHFVESPTCLVSL